MVPSLVTAKISPHPREKRFLSQDEPRPRRHSSQHTAALPTGQHRRKREGWSPRDTAPPTRRTRSSRARCLSPPSRGTTPPPTTARSQVSSAADTRPTRARPAPATRAAVTRARRPSAGAARPSTATPSSPTARSRTSHSAGPSSRCVPRPPIDDVYVFLAAGRGPRPRRVVNPHPTEYPPTKPHVI